MFEIDLLGAGLEVPAVAFPEEEPVAISEVGSELLVLKAWTAPGLGVPEPVENESSHGNLVSPDSKRHSNIGLPSNTDSKSSFDVIGDCGVGSLKWPFLVDSLDFINPTMSSAAFTYTYINNQIN